MENKRFSSKINFNGKSVFLGYFETAEKAGRAYDRSALICHGKFAVLNFK